MFDNYGHNQARTPPSQPPPPTKVLRFDKGYITTASGILKLVQLVCLLYIYLDCIVYCTLLISIMMPNNHTEDLAVYTTQSNNYGSAIQY